MTAPYLNLIAHLYSFVCTVLRFFFAVTDVDIAFQRVVAERLLKTAAVVRMSPEAFERWLQAEFNPNEKSLVVSVFSDTTLTSSEQDANVAQMLANKLKARPPQPNA